MQQVLYAHATSEADGNACDLSSSDSSRPYLIALGNPEKEERPRLSDWIYRELCVPLLATSNREA
jgi:hypothetical protein